MKKVVLVVAIFYLGSHADAAVYHFFDGEKLLQSAIEWEKSQVTPKEADLLTVAEFAGYVGAMFDHLSEKQHICTTEGITKNAVLEIVTSHLKAKKKSLEQSGSVIIEEALYKNYPCK